MSEQRRQLRVEPEDGNPIRVDINGENFVDILYANDISEGGLNVSVPHQFQDCEIDTPVSLMVQLPTPIYHNFSVKAKIRHVTGNSFGVVFQELSDENKKKLKEYISNRIQDKSWFFRLKYSLGL